MRLVALQGTALLAKIYDRAAHLTAVGQLGAQWAPPHPDLPYKGWHWVMSRALEWPTAMESSRVHALQVPGGPSVDDKEDEGVRPGVTWR